MKLSPLIFTGILSCLHRVRCQEQLRKQNTSALFEMAPHGQEMTVEAKESILKLESRSYVTITHNTPFLLQENENYPKLSKISSHGIFSMGLKNEFERAMVNEPSVFEPLKVCCTLSPCNASPVR